MSQGLKHLSVALGRRCSRSLSKKRKRSLCRYSTSVLRSSLESNPKPKETIEAVFVFHRHGDRTPGRSLVADCQANDESEFWKTKIPPPVLYERLSKRFPAIHQTDTTKIDRLSEYDAFRESSGGNTTYGFLTWKGLHQMYHQGVSVARKYTPLPNKGSFLDHWDIRAVSTNYLRTVMSCQAFMDGLLATNTKEGSLNYYSPTHYEELSLEKNDESNSIEILVRDAENETLNAFQSSPKTMKEFVRQVFETPEFKAKDEKHKPLKLQLSDYLPGLSTKSTYGGISSQSDDIRINWVSTTQQLLRKTIIQDLTIWLRFQIDAADHFVCRSSHSVPPQQFCPHLQRTNEEEHERFQQLGRNVQNHLQQRFHSYYSHPLLLAEMAGPALLEVVMEMNDAVSNCPTKKPFRIYSCHDVTILALLYAIQGISLETTNVPPPWPTYATCLTFELVRLGESTTNEHQRDSNSYIVRAWLAEAPIPEFVPSPVSLLGTQDKIDIAAFQALVHGLNQDRTSTTHAE